MTTLYILCSKGLRDKQNNAITMIEEENVKGNVVTDHSEFFSIALLHTDYPDFPIFLKKLSRFPVEIFLILPIFMLIAPLNPSLYFILSPMLYACL